MYSYRLTKAQYEASMDAGRPMLYRPKHKQACQTCCLTPFLTTPGLSHYHPAMNAIGVIADFITMSFA